MFGRLAGSAAEAIDSASSVTIQTGRMARVMREAYSNDRDEAAPIVAHSSARVKHPNRLRSAAPENITIIPDQPVAAIARWIVHVATTICGDILCIAANAPNAATRNQRLAALPRIIVMSPGLA
jgi:hypothetical protein